MKGGYVIMAAERSAAESAGERFGRRAESAEKSARTVRNKLRETPGGGDFLGGGCRFWKFTESGRRFGKFAGIRIFPYAHILTLSWDGERVERGGMAAGAGEEQAEAGGRRRERKPSENTKERKYRQRGSGK